MKNGYFSEKVHQAIFQLLWPAGDDSAGHAFLFLLRIRPEHEADLTDPDAQHWWGKVKTFLALEGVDAFAHARGLTEDQKAEFSNALWQLRSALDG